MQNHSEEENDSRQYILSNALDHYIKVEDSHLLQENTSLGGLDNALGEDNDIKVDTLGKDDKFESFHLLQGSTSKQDFCDTLDTNDIKVEEFPWWEDKNTEECLQVNEHTLTKDDTIQRKRKMIQINIHTVKRPYQCSQCGKRNKTDELHPNDPNGDNASIPLQWQTKQKSTKQPLTSDKQNGNGVEMPFMSVLEALNILRQYKFVNVAINEMCIKCNIPRNHTTIGRLKEKIDRSLKQRNLAIQSGKLHKWLTEAKSKEFCKYFPIGNEALDEPQLPHPDVPNGADASTLPQRQTIENSTKLPLTSKLERSAIDKRVDAILPSFQSIAKSENTDLVQLLLIVLVKICESLSWIKLAKLLYSVFISMNDVDNSHGMSLEKSTYLMVSQKLERDRYQCLRSTLLSEGYEVQPWHNNKSHCNDITPECIPVIVKLSEGVIGYRYNFKDICEFIINRSLLTAKITGETVPNKLYIGGKDSADGVVQHYRWAPVLVTLKDNILLYSFTPLVICAGDNADGEVLWCNPAPNSVFTKRPLAVVGCSWPLIPELDSEIRKVFVYGFDMKYMNKKVHVVVNSSLRILAGKAHSASEVLGGGYCLVCKFSKTNCHNIEYVINGFPVDHNTDMHHIFSMLSSDGELPVSAEPITQEELNTTISVTHTWVYCCSWFLNILYHLTANDNIWGFGTKQDKRYWKLIQAKLKVQETFASVLDISMSTNGMVNMAEKFFSESFRLSLSKLVINKSQLKAAHELHLNLQVILRVISSKDRKINIDKFRNLCTNTYIDIITHLNWVDLTLPVHNLLAHAPELIEKNECLGLGNLNKEGPEACNKIMSRFKAYWKLQINEKANLKDLIKKMWLNSDPVFYSYRNEVVTCSNCGSTRHQESCPLHHLKNKSDIIVEDMFIDSL